LFWKEAWLKRADETPALRGPLPTEQTGQPSAPSPCDRQRLFELTRQQDDANGNATRYRCQNTDLPLASEQLSRYDLLQYFRELTSGNVRVLEMVHAFLFFCFRKLLAFGIGYRALIWTFNRVQLWRGGTPYPFLHGQLDSTPRESLDLQQGELVQVKSHKEILETLSKTNHNRGLRFDPEMVQYCGSVQRVIGRVDHIIDERTGRMVRISSDCIMLEGTVCRAKFSDNRTFCPRRAHAYWREIWLKRLKETQVPGQR
jgi:hypothetical protein